MSEKYTDVCMNSYIKCKAKKNALVCFMHSWQYIVHTCMATFVSEKYFVMQL